MPTVGKHISDYWPNLKGRAWPTKDLGSQPTKEAVDVALQFARPNTAVGMALAMYARSSGASDSDAATAASLATGRTSATHRVKRDQLARAGLLTKTTLANDDGRQVVKISLPAKVTKKRTSKVKADKTATAE